MPFLSRKYESLIQLNNLFRRWKLGYHFWNIYITLARLQLLKLWLPIIRKYIYISREPQKLTESLSILSPITWSIENILSFRSILYTFILSKRIPFFSPNTSINENIKPPTWNFGTLNLPPSCHRSCRLNCPTKFSKLCQIDVESIDSLHL